MPCSCFLRKRINKTGVSSVYVLMELIVVFLAVISFMQTDCVDYLFWEVLRVLETRFRMLC